MCLAFSLREVLLSEPFNYGSLTGSGTLIRAVFLVLGNEWRGGAERHRRWRGGKRRENDGRGGRLIKGRKVPKFTGGSARWSADEERSSE